MTDTPTRREKKLGNINVHLSSGEELQVRRLAEAAGQSASEYTYSIIAGHLRAKRDELSVLREIFDGDGSLSSVRSAGS